MRLLFLCLLSAPLMAQPTSLLTLKQQLTLARADTTRARLLSELGRAYMEPKLDSAFFLLNQSLQLAQRQNDHVGMARAMYLLAFANLYHAKNEAKATEWVRQAATMAKAHNDYVYLAQTHELMGILAFHQHIGNADALFTQAASYAERSGNATVIGEVYGGWYDAEVSSQRKNYARQEELLRKAIDAARVNDSDHAFTLELDYCNVLAAQNKPVLAVARRLAVDTSRLLKSRGEFVYRCDMGRLYMHLNQLDKAEAAFRKAIGQESQQPHPDSLHLLYYRQNLAKVLLRQQAWQKAYENRHELAQLELWRQRTRQTRDAKLQMTEMKAATDIEEKEEQIRQQRMFLVLSLLVVGLLVSFVIVLSRARRRIEQQRTELGHLNATKDKLFAMLSHDLRSPVGMLKNYLMLQHWGALPKEQFEQLTQELGERLGQVQTMLDNLLQWSLSQLSGFRAYPQWINVKAAIDAEIQLLLPLASSKNVVFSQNIPDDCPLAIDPNHFSIIIRNLLQNALKFTESGGSITIWYDESDDQKQLRIQDTGVGISPEKLETLFQLHEQTSAKGTANESGTGLGLVLVRELLEANRGTVEVESQHGKGSTFTLTFLPDDRHTLNSSRLMKDRGYNPAGYQKSSYFTRLFRERFGINPGEISRPQKEIA